MFEQSGLSERELEILKLVATGASNKEIATQLVISPNTVKVHLRNIFSKIDVVSRTEATLYAIKIGLIKPESTVPDDAPPEPVTRSASSESPLTKRPWLRWVMAVVFLAAIAPLILMWIRPNPAQNPQTSISNPEDRWLTFTDMPSQNYGMAGTAYEGKAYLIGGSQEGKTSAEVWAYDAATDKWLSKAEKPTAMTAASAALIGEKIYVPGGLSDTGAALDVMEIYDPRNDTWEKGAPMPTALGGYALTSFEGKLFLFGGWDGTDFSSLVFTYDPVDDTWTKLAEMTNSRAWACAAAIGAKIFLVGGENSSGVLKDTLAFYPDRLDGNGDAWERRADLPAGRKSAAMTSLAGGLYLAGGSGDNGTVSLPFLKYDEINDQWDALEDPIDSAGEQLSLIALDTRIHFFGGSFQGVGQTAHKAYQAIYTVLIPAISR